MKRFCALLLMCQIWGPVHAGLKFGLGSAVADHDAEIIHADRLKNPLLNLRTCTDTEYAVSPIDLSNDFSLDPLGHMSGVGGHLFPTDHIYFYVHKATSATPTINVYAPGNIVISQVASSEYRNASPVFTDYSLRFATCQGLTGYFFHINGLSSELQSKIDSVSGSCGTYPDGSIYYCTKDVAIPVTVGDVLGTITGRTGSSFFTLDFGMQDHNQPALSYITPARQISEHLYTRCPLERFEEPLKSQLVSRLGRYDGTQQRTDEPVCGETMQDVPGSAQGLWYVPGTPQSPVQDPSPHMALVHDNVLTSTGVFSVGNSVSSLPGTQYYFDTTNSGLVNLDFNLVTSNGTVYCYENFSNLLNSIVLLQLPSSTTLKIEKQTAASCGAGPWTFTGAATTFER